MASIYYDCLSLPEELELKIMGMKRGMEIYDIQLENKKKLLDHINDFEVIVYEDQGFYYDDIDETHIYYRWIRTVKDMDWYEELLGLRKEEEDEESGCGCIWHGKNTICYNDYNCVNCGECLNWKGYEEGTKKCGDCSVRI